MAVKLLLFTVNIVIICNLVQNKLILEQVVIFNRHGLRTPLSKNFDKISPKAWPKWKEEPGFMTAKGIKLTGYMGSYFGAWLKKEKVLPSSCPSENDLYVLSNTLERTLTSAESFVKKGFPDCSIAINHTGNAPNPVFNPIIHNDSTTFSELALEEMKAALNSVQLNECYEMLSNILDYKKSKMCEIYKKCNLAEDDNEISITPGLRPRLVGPLKIADEIIDTFLMQNYEGFLADDVAWGQLNNASLWKAIIKLNRAYYNVTYKTRLVAKDLSGPLIKFMLEMFFKHDNKPKVTLLVGHDANIYTLLQTLEVKQYELDNQYEVTPIGGAVVFQKWRDYEHEMNYLKINYIYQSTEQLRYSYMLNLESPPQIKTLELEKCKIDKDGFCPWDDFKTFLVSLF